MAKGSTMEPVINKDMQEKHPGTQNSKNSKTFLVVRSQNLRVSIGLLKAMKLSENKKQYNMKYHYHNKTLPPTPATKLNLNQCPQNAYEKLTDAR